MKIISQYILLLCILLSGSYSWAQSSALDRHDFFYAGESKRPRMFVVEKGSVVWEHEDTTMRGEISDAVRLKDGNVLVAHQYGIAEVAPDHSTVWRYATPSGTEIHTIQPVGENMVLFVQNGTPAKVVIMEIPSCKVVKEFKLPYDEKGSVHGQFRNARLSSRGTLLLANMGMNYVGEYNSEGKEIDRWDINRPWSVTEVGKANNLLIVAKGIVREIDRRGNVIWEINTKNLGLNSPQKAVRLKNGNTIITNWFNDWGKTPVDINNPPVQAVEVTPAGEVVWTLSEWNAPDLGPATTIQLLNSSVDRRSLFFGELNGRSPRLFVEPNTPLGVAKGAVPGRVAWVHAPGVASWDGPHGALGRGAMEQSAYR